MSEAEAQVPSVLLDLSFAQRHQGRPADEDGQRWSTYVSLWKDLAGVGTNGHQRPAAQRRQETRCLWNMIPGETAHFNLSSGQVVLIISEEEQPFIQRRAETRKRWHECVLTTNLYLLSDSTYVQ